jgi:putative Flp pilus-assembly TadE/G-like protein
LNAELRNAASRARGQTLAIFALFLVVLLGASAIAIDYANWLLTDRQLQNAADHAALAGSSVFNQNVNHATCSTSPGDQLCIDARTQAWKSLSQELGLNLDDTQLTCLADPGIASGGDTPEAGWTNAGDAGCTPKPFRHRLWVATPPPSNASYTGPGGSLNGNFGIVWVRVDRPTRTFFGSVFNIAARDRIGWATAGVLPSDFALELYCRDGTDPGGSNRTCVSKGVGIEGQGGITLVRGDIGSNQSLQVTANTGQGVILEDGNAFLVSGLCGPSTWNCPPATAGGISDGSGNAKNAFHIPPQPIPHYASPLDGAGVSDQRCSGASATDLCVPNRPATGNGAGQPGDWRCNPIDGSQGLNNMCGTPTVSTTVSGVSSIRCDATLGGTPSRYLVPSSDGRFANQMTGSPVPSSDRYTFIDDNASATPPDPDTTNPPANPPADYLYTSNLNGSGGSATQTVNFNLRPPYGLPRAGATQVSYVVFKTNNGALDTSGTGNAVTVTVQLLQAGSVIFTDAAQTLTGTPTLHQFSPPVNAITDYTTLSLRLTYHSTGSNSPSSVKRGGGISWAQAYTPPLDPALPAMIPPGYYHSVTIPDGGCAIMDPTAQYWGWTYGKLLPFQLPGIYRFGTGSDASINVGAGSFLIGDGVTLVFNPEFPDPTGGRGIVIGADGALVLNTSRVIGTPPCTPSETETQSYNPSAPALDALPYSSVCAAFAIDASATAGVHPGAQAWPYCDPLNATNTQCVNRSDYAPTANYRGVTFYFSYATWPPTSISSRFQMSGSAGSEPGIAFRGILYAPYDDVKITSSNDFNTVGQVLAWTAKFAGQATIFLDYPYERCVDTNTCQPYLLEPTVGQ